MAPRKKKTEIIVEPKMEDNIPEVIVDHKINIEPEPSDDLKGTFNNVEPIRKPIQKIPRRLRKLD